MVATVAQHRTEGSSLRLQPHYYELASARHLFKARLRHHQDAKRREERIRRTVPCQVVGSSRSRSRNPLRTTQGYYEMRILYMLSQITWLRSKRLRVQRPKMLGYAWSAHCDYAEKSLADFIQITREEFLASNACVANRPPPCRKIVHTRFLKAPSLSALSCRSKARLAQSAICFACF